MIIIQEEISITEKEVDECIEHYKELPDTFRLGILGTVLDKKGIIKEIKKLTEFGKEILLMHYDFKKWEKQQVEDNEKKKLKPKG